MDSPKRQHVRDLDAWRGIAIFGVVMTHVVSSLALMGLYPPWVHLDLTQFFVTGGLGVQLFFLLSGFLLTTTEGRRRAAGTSSLRAYVWRRFLRLAPAYYLSLLLLLAYALAQGAYHPRLNPLADLAIYLSFTHTLWVNTGSDLNPAYWSLACEVAFYALLPLVLRYAPALPARLALYLASLALAGGLYYWYGSSRDIGLQFYLLFHPATHLHLFLAGSLLAAVAERRDRGLLRLRLPASVGDLALLLALCGLTLNAYLVCPTPALKVLSRLGGETLVALGFAAYVLRSPILRLVLALPGLAYLGRISYSLYLFHGLLISLGEQAGLARLLRSWAEAGVPRILLFGGYLAAALAASIAVASLTYRWVEEPGMRGFRRTSRRVPARLGVLQPALAPAPVSEAAGPEWDRALRPPARR